MSQTIDIQFDDEAVALMKRLGDTPGLLNVMAHEMDAQNQLTIAHISSERMRGNNGKPFPVSEHKLGIRSAHLVKSIRASKAVISGNQVISTIGSNVKYAGIHEFGGTIKRVLLAGSVRLRTDRGGNLLRRGRNGKLAVFAKKSHNSVQTVSFAGGKRYEITIPARAPFSHGIQDRVPEISTALSRTVKTFLSKGGLN